MLYPKLMMFPFATNLANSLSPKVDLTLELARVFMVLTGVLKAVRFCQH